MFSLLQNDLGIYFLKAATLFSVYFPNAEAAQQISHLLIRKYCHWVGIQLENFSSGEAARSDGYRAVLRIWEIRRLFSALQPTSHASSCELMCVSAVWC